MAESTFKEGLEDIVALSSAISYIDGQEGRLLYQGYDIADLVQHSTFEETTYLLWHGELPTPTELKEHLELLAHSRSVPSPILDHLRLVPNAAVPMEVLRTAVSLLPMYDVEDTAEGGRLQAAAHLVARMPTIVAAYHRLRSGLEPLDPRTDLSLAANFLYMLTGDEPDPEQAKVFDAALILHADHELNASTFAARVTAATLSDLYSAITAAISALKGPLHGGANEAVMRMLLEIGGVDQAEAWIEERLANKEKIMGFGHRVYKTEDPRAVVLKRFSQKLGERAGAPHWFEMSQVIANTVVSEKGIYPNVDFYSASMYYVMGIPVDLYTPIFACSRASGWTAHILEQYENNRLIRPRAEYIGPTRRPYVAQADR